MSTIRQEELPFLDPDTQAREFMAWLDEAVPNRRMVNVGACADIIGTKQDHVSALITSGRLLAVDTSRRAPRFSRYQWRVPPSSLKLLMLGNDADLHTSPADAVDEWERQRQALKTWLARIVPNRNLRVQEVADLLGVSRRHVEQLIADGQLKALDVSVMGADRRCKTIPRASVVSWVLLRSELC